MTEPIHTHSDSIEIAAPPEKIWDMVTSMDRYGEWSSENTGGYWRKGPDGEPGTGKVGDVFVGVNKLGDDEWKAPVEIVTRDEGRTFGFVTGGLEFNIALWQYQLEPTDTGTTLTEYYELRTLSPRMVEHGESEVEYRRNNMITSIRATLEGIKAAAEAD
jgi:uncharacterized protein YndB with AHSA1/START domain